MAVAMETTIAGAWRGSELPLVVLTDGKSSSKSTKTNKASNASWGADAQKLMQMMLGQLHSTTSHEPPAASDHQCAQVRDDIIGDNGIGAAASGIISSVPADGAQLSPELSTLDLFDIPRSSQLEECSRGEFLELEPEEEPLPSGWEKCLDLKSGKLYYVQKSSGVSTFNDPRRRTTTTDTELHTQTLLSPNIAAHEFLGSKKSETLRQENSNLKTSSSSSSESPRLTRKQHSSLDLFQWNLQSLEDDRHNNNIATLATVSCAEIEEVELDLNLGAGGSPSSRLFNRQTVCTMEMIQNALRRTEKNLHSPGVVKREMGSLQQHNYKLSVSSSFSSLTSTVRSDPIDCCTTTTTVAPSPSTSSSSSTSSKSRRASKVTEQSTLKSSSTNSTGVCEERDISNSGALVMGACTRCLMYVMLKKIDPKCPRCESEVPVDFSDPPCKRQRVQGLERREV